ncbi:GNAT family N-acetyltransferase [Amycolatopsis sp. NPDC003861]
MGELYKLLHLRVQVFIVEQHIAYPDIDGIDLARTTHHFWSEIDNKTTACLRVTQEQNGTHRIGRVCTKIEYRRRGMATNLILSAIAAFSRRIIILDAQSQAVDFYRRFGFEISGQKFLDDDVPHFPMQRLP